MKRSLFLSIPPQRAYLGRRLRELRSAVFPTGTAFAAHLAERFPDASWRQTRVSKIERGDKRPNETDIIQWLDAAGADEAASDEIWALLASVRVEYATFGANYARSGGASAHQHAIARTEAATRHLRHYQPAMIPGLVQTPAYARELLTADTGPTYFGATRADIEAMLHTRVQRQEVLYDTTKTVEIVLGEAALRTHFGTVDTLVGQLDRLTQIAELSTVTVGVIPFTTALPAFPLSGFDLMDEVVTIETLAGDQVLDDPADVALYTKAYEQLCATAATGADAIAVIQRIAAELRESS